MIFKLIGTSLCFLAITPFTFANCHTVRRFNYTPVHHAAPVKKVIKVVETPYIAVPVAVFQYLPAVQTSLSVPIQQQLQQHQSVPIQQQQQQQQQQIQQQHQQQIPQPTTAPTDDGPPPLILPNETVSEQNESVDASIQSVANMLAGKSCVECHTSGVKTSGDVTLFVKQNDQLLFQPNVELGTILNAVKGPAPRMPPAARGDPNHPSALKQNEVALLTQVVNSNRR